MKPAHLDDLLVLYFNIVFETETDQSEIAVPTEDLLKMFRFICDHADLLREMFVQAAGIASQKEGMEKFDSLANFFGDCQPVILAIFFVSAQLAVRLVNEQEALKIEKDLRDRNLASLWN